MHLDIFCTSMYKSHFCKKRYFLHFSRLAIILKKMARAQGKITDKSPLGQDLNLWRISIFDWSATIWRQEGKVNMCQNIFNDQLEPIDVAQPYLGSCDCDDISEYRQNSEPGQLNLRRYQRIKQIIKSYRWTRICKFSRQKCCIYKFPRQKCRNYKFSRQKLHFWTTWQKHSVWL